MGSHRFFFSDGFLSFFFYLLDFLLVVVFTFSFPTMIRSFVRKIKRGKKNAKMEANSNDGNDKDNNNENNDKDKNMDFNNNNNKKNKDFIVYRGAREIQTPYAFLRAHPGGEFPGHVGDAVHLIFKDKAKGEYECRLADGTGRHATIPIEYLDVIVDVDNILKEAA